MIKTGHEDFSVLAVQDLLSVSYDASKLESS
jgi:hypothetical protein